MSDPPGPVQIDPKINEQNKRTLAAAGTPYLCFDLDCEEEPEYVLRREGRVAAWLCPRHAVDTGAEVDG